MVEEGSQTSPAEDSECGDDTKTPYPWILGPVIDYLFVTGGLVWIFVLLNYLLLGANVPWDKNSSTHLLLIASLYIFQHLIFDAHNVATYFRLWGSERDRTRFRFYRTWLLYASAAVIVLGILIPSLPTVMVYMYMVTTFWHFAMQSFGVALIYFEKRNYILSVFEKEIFRALMLSLSLFVTMRFLTIQDFAPTSFYGVASPFWVPMQDPVSNMIFLFSSASFVFLSLVFLFILAKKLFTEKRLPPLPAIVLLGTIFALGLSSQILSSMLWLYVPVFFHASQYLAVFISYHLKERGLKDGAKTSEIAKELTDWYVLKYFGKAILIGFTLFIIFPHCCNLILGSSYLDMAGLVFAVVNYHHFATDAAIWQMRDKKTRDLLVA